MKCSICGSTNMVKIDEERKGKYHIEYFACKDCCHVDAYCFDFKKKNEVEELTNKLLNGIKELRIKSLGNKEELINKYYNAVSIIRCAHPSEEISKEILNITKSLTDIKNYLNVDELKHINEEDSYDEDFNAIKKDIYYIGDFPINFKDCTNGPSIFFFMSHKEYKNLETVKNHTSNTTVLDVMVEYYETEAKNHIFYPLNEEIKNKKWYIEAKNDDKLTNEVNLINEIITLFNK